MRHKGSYLGLVWAVLNPLLLLGLYVLVFGYIFGGSFNVLPNETPIDYGLGIFLGLNMFHFAAEALNYSVGSIVSNPNFVKKVVFPLEILPLSHVGSATIHLIIGFGLVMAGQILFGSGSVAGALWLPVIIFPLILFTVGVCWLVSGLGVFLRDISAAMQFLIMALMFSSAVFYSASSIPAAAWEFMRFNPLLIAIELSRDAMLWSQPINPTHLGYLYAIGAATAGLGLWAFSRMKSAFADVI